MPVTQEDIAQELGISRTLVGYALKGNTRVSAQTRARVSEAVKKLGYRPNTSARALVTGRTYQIHLCLPALGNSFFSELIRQFENLSQDTPYDLVVTSVKGLQCRPDSLAGDGSILCGVEFYPNALQPENVVTLRPTLTDEKPDEAKATDTVLMDIYEASMQGMEHLFDQGFTEVTYVAPHSNLEETEPRYAVYHRAMAKAGLQPVVVDVPIDFEGRIREQTADWLVGYFAKNGVPQALFCANDDIAVGAYRALRELGQEILGKTAILGHDDISEAQDLTPALSTVQLHLEDICSCAWAMLMDRLETGRTVTKTASFKAELVIRESSLNAANQRATIKKKRKPDL